MDLNDTIAQFKERLAKDSSDIEAALTLGNIYYDNGDPVQSIQYYRRVLDINPDMPGVRTDMGTMLWRNNDMNQAEKAFRDAIACDPGFGHAYINLGLLLHRGKGELNEARIVWQQLLDNNPNHELAAKARQQLQENPALTIPL